MSGQTEGHPVKFRAVLPATQIPVIQHPILEQEARGTHAVDVEGPLIGQRTVC